jgi:hypothetical protein
MLENYSVLPLLHCLWPTQRSYISRVTRMWRRAKSNLNLSHVLNALIIIVRRWYVEHFQRSAADLHRGPLRLLNCDSTYWEFSRFQDSNGLPVILRRHLALCLESVAGSIILSTVAESWSLCSAKSCLEPHSSPAVGLMYTRNDCPVNVWWPSYSIGASEPY